VAGPWNRRLPHFRMEFTPSRGEELQSEYLVPRSEVATAIERVRALAPTFGHLLQVTEVRTIAADRLWLSGAYGADAVGLHFTWLRDVEGVYAVLPAIEDALLPLGARPHWGKAFVADADRLRPAYPRFDDFRALADRLDPEHKFRNAWLARHLDLA
jgi:xylitol oxidase